MSIDESLYFVKGMPETVLGECVSHTSANGMAVALLEDVKSRILEQSRRMAASGLRVLALAYGVLSLVLCCYKQLPVLP